MLCALFAALLAPSVRAAAAQAGAPSTVALTKINLVSQNDREAHLQLIVEPRVNGFQALSNNPRDPTLALALTSRTASAVTPRELRGFVKGIDFVQAEGVLVLHFRVDQGATVAAVPSGDRIIEVSVAAIDQPSHQAASSVELGPASLQNAYQRPPGQDSYALIPLKYADVS